MDRCTRLVMVVARAEDLEASPAIVGQQRYAKDVADLAVEVGQVALRMMDRAHRDGAQAL